MDTPDEMCELSALREDYPKLDQDLHEHVSDYDDFKKAQKAKRDAEREGTDSGYATAGGGGGWEDTNSLDVAAGGWDTAAPAAVGGWNDAGAAGAQSPDDTNKENVAPAATAEWDQGGEGNDWADEVNDSTPPVAASGW